MDRIILCLISFLVFSIAAGPNESSLAASIDSGVLPSGGVSGQPPSSDSGVLPSGGVSGQPSSSDSGVLPSGGVSGQPSSSDSGVLPSGGVPARTPLEETEGAGIEDGGFWERLEHIYTELKTDIEQIINSINAYIVIK